MIAAGWDGVLKNVVFGASAASAGLGIYLAYVNARDAIRIDPWQWGFALARIGYVIVVLTVAEVVYQIPGLPGTAKVYFYLLGLVLGGVGFLIIAMAHRRGLTDSAGRREAYAAAEAKRRRGHVVVAADLAHRQEKQLDEQKVRIGMRDKASKLLGRQQVREALRRKQFEEYDRDQDNLPGKEEDDPH